MTEFATQNTQSIHAYLDGELDANDYSAFELRLAQEPQLAERLVQEAAFRRALQHRLTGEVAPTRLRAKLTRDLTQPARWQTAWWSDWSNWWTTPLLRPATVLACLLVWSLGLGIAVWWLSQPISIENESAFQQLAGKHKVYVQSSDVAVDVTGSSEEVAAWLGQRVSFPVAVPEIEGWPLLGGRLGEFNQTATAHLIYRNKAGLACSLILFQPEEHDFPPNAAELVDGQTVFVDDERQTTLWQNGTVGYGLVMDDGLPQEVQERLTRKLIEFYSS